MARNEGRATPKRDTGPEYSVELGLYVTAYLELDSERDYLSPIPWTAKAKYCEFYGFDSEQAEWLMAIIKRVDNAVLLQRQKEAKSKHGENTTRPSARR